MPAVTGGSPSRDRRSLANEENRWPFLKLRHGANRSVLDGMCGARGRAGKLRATMPSCHPERSRFETDDSAEARGAIELREGLAISAARERRAAINVDPIAAQVMAGTWAMPRSGDAVTFREARSRSGNPSRLAADGWFSGGALRGGYLAASFSATDASVMMLEAAGHAMVYADGEPRAGDIYSTGYRSASGPGAQGAEYALVPGRPGTLKARLTKPKAAAFFSTADMTLPDLKPVNPPGRGGRSGCQCERYDRGKTWSLRPVLPAARKPERPSLLWFPCRYVRSAFELRGTAPTTGETASLELKLERKASMAIVMGGRRSTRPRSISGFANPARHTRGRFAARSTEACNTTPSCRHCQPARDGGAAGWFSHFTERESKASARRSAYAAQARSVHRRTDQSPSLRV